MLLRDRCQDVLVEPRVVERLVAITGGEQLGVRSETMAQVQTQRVRAATVRVSRSRLTSHLGGGMIDILCFGLDMWRQSVMRALIGSREEIGP